MQRLLSALILFALLAASSSAATITYVALLNGPNENPANPSLGTGTATLIIDTTANTASLTVTFGGLSSPTNGAHIHCCVNPPANVGIAIPSVTLPIGVLQGSFSANYDLLLGAIWDGNFFFANGASNAGATNALLAGLANGQAYYNIHTQGSTGGEIRGFFAVPEPGAALMLGAVAALAMCLRRRSA